MSEELQKILIVEDDSDIAKMLEVILKQKGGFEVVHCFTGITALEVAPEFLPQMILLDVMMPEMDGIETFKRLQQMPSVKEIPVVFVTARIQKHEREEYFRLGALGVIGKPFDPLSLCDQLTSLWKEKYHKL